MGDGVEEVVVARVEHGVAHASEDTKHGTTAVLDLDVEGAVTGLGVGDLGGERVSSGDGSGRSVVAARKVLGSSGVLVGRHGNSLGEGTEEGDLDETESGDGAQGSETHTVSEDTIEGVVSGEVEGSREGDAELLDHHTDEGRHGDTSVLDLDGTTTGEALGIVKETKGVEEVERTGVDTKTVGGTGITVDGGAGAGALEGREKERPGWVRIVRE